LKPLTTRAPSTDNRSGDASLGDLLLTTKLNVPSTRSNLVVRPRLLELLDEGSRDKLTLISAPAGYGKTTLLGEWVLRSELPVGWLSLDEGDNDSTTFFSYLISALKIVETEIGENVLRSLRSPQPPPSQAVLTALVNEVSSVPKDVALILDDYHVITNEAVHAALAFLLEHLPPQMHLIIASRTDPPLPLARLLVGGHLTKLAASDLRFTPEEAGSFLNEAMRLELSAEDLAALEERTEGWVAGLQLAALSVRGRKDVSRFIAAFAGTDRHVFDYLAEEVLDRQSNDTRSFLLETSILDRLSGPLCDAVTGQGGGQAKLEELERMNLLVVPLGDERHWYRYHHLFSDFLRQRLRQESPKLVLELHRQASGWHERNGMASEAIGHAVAAGDFDRAGDLTERLAGEMGGRGEGPALERLLRALPEEVLRSRPRLQLFYAVKGGANGVKDAAGNPLSADEVWTFTTQAAVLSAPSNLSATRSGSPTNQRIDLSWTDNSSSEAGFVIERSTTSSFTTNLVTFPETAANTTSYGDRNLQKKTTYYYRVFAVDSTGTRSAPSNVASATTR
jgi:LuxR family maltose regulon positive regulatory protein